MQRPLRGTVSQGGTSGADSERNGAETCRVTRILCLGAIGDKMLYQDRVGHRIFLLGNTNKQTMVQICKMNVRSFSTMDRRL